MQEMKKPLLGRKGRGKKTKKRLMQSTTSPAPRQALTHYIIQDCDTSPAKSFRLFVDFGGCDLMPCQEVRYNAIRV